MTYLIFLICLLFPRFILFRAYGIWYIESPHHFMQSLATHTKHWASCVWEWVVQHYITTFLCSLLVCNALYINFNLNYRRSNYITIFSIAFIIVYNVGECPIHWMKMLFGLSFHIPKVHSIYFFTKNAYEKVIGFLLQWNYDMFVRHICTKQRDKERENIQVCVCVCVRGIVHNSNTQINLMVFSTKSSSMAPIQT